MSGIRKIFFTCCVTAFALVSYVDSAHAVAQFARKYKTPCSTCHTAFPRLNYYGERFLWNGYQDPDKPLDGDTLGKTPIGNDWAIDKVENYLGARLNINAVQYMTDATTVNGHSKDTVQWGNASSAGLFLAGSMFSHGGFFVENTFTDSSASFSNYYMIFNRIWDTPLLNVMVGNLSPLKFASYSAGDAFGVIDAKGATSAADHLSSSGLRRGIQYYGYTGPAFWWAGISQGATPEVNQADHYWLGIRGNVPETCNTDFEGSNISGWFYRGADTNTGDALAASQVKDDYYRYSAAANLRWKDALDVQAAYLWGHDKNWALDGAAPAAVDFNGPSIKAAYLWDKWYPSITYTRVNSSDVKSLEDQFITPALTYLWTENFEIIGSAKFDAGHNTVPGTHHTFLLSVSTMF